MKRVLLALLTIVLGATALAQMPSGFNYQAVVRNEAGQLLDQRYVSIRISIRHGAADGTLVYQLTDNVRTNANGLVSVVVGENSPLYDSIDWSDGPYYLVSEIDPNNGNNYTLSTSQLILSVPYAEHARTADRISEAFVYDEVDPEFRSWGYQYDSLVGAPTTISWDSIVGIPTNLGTTTILWDSVIGVPTTILWDSIIGAPTTIAWDSITGVPTTIAWDSVAGRPDTLMLGADTVLYFGHDSLYSVDLKSLVDHTLPWDSITGVPTSIDWSTLSNIPDTLSYFINDIPLTLGADDTLYVGADSAQRVDLSPLRTLTLPWDSITGVPTTIAWDSVAGRPDTLMLGADTVLYFGHDSLYSVDLKSLVDHTLPWDSITGVPTTIAWDSVVGRPDTLMLGADTVLYFGHDSLYSVDLKSLVDHTLPWDSITGVPTTIDWSMLVNVPDTLSYFINDIPLTLGADDTLYVGADSAQRVDLSPLRTLTLPWDSIRGRPDTLMLGADTVLYFGHDSLYSVDLKSLVDHTLPWDSIIGAPTTIEWDSVVGAPTTIEWDSIIDAPTTIEWDSIVGAPTTIAWDSISGHPDTLMLGADTVLYFGHDSLYSVDLKSLVDHTLPWDSITGAPTTIEWDSVVGAPTTIEWDSIVGAPTTIEWTNVTNRPTMLSEFANDVPLVLSAGDTLYVGADSSQWVNLRPLLRWSNVAGRPSYLSQFANDLDPVYNATLYQDTLFIGNHDTVDLRPLKTLSLPWTSITGRPSKLSQFQNDLRIEKVHDTLFLADSVIYLHRSTLYTHWDSIVGAPSDVSYFNNDAGYITQASVDLPTAVANDNRANGQIKALATPTDAADATNKAYVDALVDSLGGIIDSLSEVIRTIEHPLIEGQLAGRFSVAAGRMVCFSKGNLQYNPLMELFRFADNQYDISGISNADISQKNLCASWLDLFGYGTSTWKGGRDRCYMPYETSSSNDEYMLNDGGNDLDSIYRNADWGQYNAIVNGGNVRMQWRTLKWEEWDYLLNDRPNAANLRTSARVGGVNGLIILPDDWVAPAGVTITPRESLSASNYYTLEAWQQLEAAGAVFLPNAGSRSNKDVDVDASKGWYWTSTHNSGSNTQAVAVYINNDSRPQRLSVVCSQGCSVRLVRDY